jgi:hypothetical protein
MAVGCNMKPPQHGHAHPNSCRRHAIRPHTQAIRRKRGHTHTHQMAGRTYPRIQRGRENVFLNMELVNEILAPAIRVVCLMTELETTFFPHTPAQRLERPGHQRDHPIRPIPMCPSTLAPHAPPRETTIPLGRVPAHRPRHSQACRNSDFRINHYT